MNPFLFRLFRDNEVKVHELNYLFWECTTRCNFHCRHCGSDCGIVRSSDDSGSNTTSASQSRQKDMPLEDFLAAIDTIPVQDRARNFCAVLTGGEPLLRPDILEIGRELRSRGLLWGIVSNGWFYDDAMHLKLMDAGMGAVTVSLDGLEASHDWMRGVPGSYNRAVRAIGAFARDPRLKSDVVTCVNRRNLNELPEIYDLLKSKGLKQWRLFTIIPIGRAVNDPDMHLTDKEFVTLMEFIKSKREEARQTLQLRQSQSSQPMNVTFSCEGYLGKYEEKVRDVRYFCHAGINIASVLIDGRICACPNIDRDRFSQGNIYTDNLWQVWNERFQPFRDRSWAKTGSCADCKQWRNCLGNGMHNWHGPVNEVLQCHYAKTLD